MEEVGLAGGLITSESAGSFQMNERTKSIPDGWRSGHRPWECLFRQGLTTPLSPRRALLGFSDTLPKIR